MEIKNKNSRMLLLMLCVFGISGSECTEQRSFSIVPDSVLHSQLQNILIQIYRYINPRRRPDKVLEQLNDSSTRPAQQGETEKILDFINQTIQYLPTNNSAQGIMGSSDSSWVHNPTEKSYCRTYRKQPDTSTSQAGDLKVTVYLNEDSRMIKKIGLVIARESITITGQNPYDPPASKEMIPSITHIQYENGFGSKWIVNMAFVLPLTFAQDFLLPFEVENTADR